MPPFDRVMNRLHLYANGIHPDTGEKLAHSDNTHKNNKGFYRFIHTDSDFLLAQNWGMEPGGYSIISVNVMV
jgi:hypothetical protein